MDHQYKVSKKFRSRYSQAERPQDFNSSGKFNDFWRGMWHSTGHKEKRRPNLTVALYYNLNYYSSFCFLCEQIITMGKQIHTENSQKWQTQRNKTWKYKSFYWFWTTSELHVCSSFSVLRLVRPAGEVCVYHPQ